MAPARKLELALVSQVEAVATEELRRVARALQTQIDRDFTPLWQVEARISVFPTATDVPPGVWPIVILAEIDTPGAGAYHSTRDGVPFGQVEYSDSWSLAASHQCMDMLADPWGNRLVGGLPSPNPEQGNVEVLVQICDPVEAAEFAYTIDDVLVSDFVTPAYYGGSGEQFDIQRRVSRPLEVLRGGYLSWHDPADDHWWQLVFFDDEPKFKDLGRFDSGESEAAPAEEEEPSSRDAAKRAPRRRRKQSPEAPAAPAPEPAREPELLSVVPGALNDQVATVDLLGFRDYVLAFADLIESEDTTPPITIGIYGAWGSGKSFLLQGIEAELLERERQRQRAGDQGSLRMHVIGFNAWEYSSSAAIWPALVRQIVVCVQKELPWRFPGRFLRRLWRNLRWEIRQERAKLLGALVTAMLLLAAVLWKLDFKVGPLAAAAATLGAAGLIKVVGDTLTNPLSRWMTAVLTNGDYGEPTTGVMNRIQDDLKKLSERLARENGRFVVMIDDLDRCEPGKVVEVLQAINLLLGFESFIVCLGIDARVITGAIERHYEGLLGAAGASGYEYLDKIVQIPFRIPRPNAAEVETFITSQLQQATNGATGAPANGTPAPTPQRGPSVPTPAALTQSPGARTAEPAPERVAFDPGEVAAFEDLAEFLEPNPRHVKRLINVYRLVRSLAGVRHVESSVRRDPEGVILLLTLAAQWPYTAAAMLDEVGPVVEAEAAGSSWPEGSPLTHLHGLASPNLDLSRQRALDRDPEHLAKLLARAENHLGWKALDSLRRYVVNFNPAVEEELRRSQAPPANVRAD